MRVKISVKMMRLKFRPCEPNYIRDYCKGACCRSSSGKTIISIHKGEEEKFKKMEGCTVVNGLLNPELPRCKFQSDVQLCMLHGDNQPLGCIASPFTLNKRDTLIIRHRYLMFKCHSKSRKAVPAYRAHFRSLKVLFGEQKATEIANKLTKTKTDFYVDIDENIYNILKDNDDTKRNQVPLFTRVN